MTSRTQSPLATYQERHGAAVVARDAANRKVLALTPIGDGDREPADEALSKAQLGARAAEALHGLTEAQLKEATARRRVTAAAAAHATWPAYRRVFWWRNVTFVLWAPWVVGCVFAVWSLALGLLVLALAVFIVTAGVLRSSYVASEAAGAIGEFATGMAEAALRGATAAFGALARGSRGHRDQLLAECIRASNDYEDDVVALYAAERGLPFTEVYPLAQLDEETAARMEAHVWAEVARNDAICRAVREAAVAAETA